MKNLFKKINLINILLICFCLIANAKTETIQINIIDYGADPTGKINSSKAIQNVSNYVNMLDKNIIKNIVIPKGNYKIGIINNNSINGFQASTFFLFSNQENINIIGNNAVFKFEENLLFGSFETKNNKKVKTNGVNTNSLFAYSIGTMLKFNNCKNVNIKNLILNGNCSKYIFGGEWGDKGIQLISYGIQLFGCENVKLNNIVSSYFGTDGLYLAKYNDDCKNIIITNSSFEYNCRQGLSITSGKNINIDSSKFNYSGFFYPSNPCSGIDIESESDGQINEVVIKNSEMNKNINFAFISYNSFKNKDYSKKIKDITIQNCLLQSINSFVLEADNENIQFKNCHIIGTILNGNQTNDVNKCTKFINCKIDDNTTDSINYFNRSLYYNYSVAGKNYFDKCNFLINNTSANSLSFIQNTSYPIIQKNIIDSSYFIILKDCNFNSNNNKLFNGDYYTTIIGNACLMGKNTFNYFKNEKNNLKKGNIYFDNVYFCNGGELVLKSNDINFIFRKEVYIGDIKNNANKIIVENGVNLMINDCNLTLNKNGLIIVKKGGTINVLNNCKLINKGKIVIEKGGNYVIPENISRKNIFIN